MHPSFRTALDKFLARATQQWGGRIEEVILFGSTARGEATAASDVDLLVITSGEDFHLRRNLIGLAYDIMLETGVNLSVKVLSRDDMERGRYSPFLKAVLTCDKKAISGIAGKSAVLSVWDVPTMACASGNGRV